MESSVDEQCNKHFLHRIQSRDFHDAACPYTLADICKLGPTAAYTIDSDWISANAIGINTNSGLEFRSSVTCSPIVEVPSWIQYRTDNKNHSFIDYNYKIFVKRNRTHGNFDFSEQIPVTIFTQNLINANAEYSLGGYNVE